MSGCLLRDLQTLQDFGFIVNLKRGKSAALFSLRGKGKQQVERDLYNNMGFKIDFEVDSKRHELHVALDYKYVGCFVQNSGSQAKEFKHRSGTANSSLTLLRRRVFSRAAINAKAKTTVTQAISFGQLYFCEHTSSRPVPSIERGYDSVHLRIAKTVVGWRPNSSWQHLASEEILALASLPSSSLWVSASRLRYLGRFVHVGPDHLHALVEIAAPLKSSWHRLIWQDIAHLRTISDECPADNADLF